MRRILIALAALTTIAAPSMAGDCDGKVVKVKPISQYNHATGTGFLAVRSGPGSNFQQIGELYLGDRASVWDKSGNWLAVTCVSGRCRNPLWGQPSPQGWAHKSYLQLSGVCPR
ncbi:MAG: SH3 domain-containing protein [Rhizobiaceae bacterium]|nr:SH3 domain-containing protein [Rhizobiaceae bacterium]